ncbi:otogelin [Sardina pilchardus]|uniref:otogelin n=1 Tax=Sardina pilchardus TaxID=27697 RepID=UPI002E149352
MSSGGTIDPCVLCEFGMTLGPTALPAARRITASKASRVEPARPESRGFEREMTCRSWGQYNFETFDGLYFYYPGKCTYTLLRDCEDTTQSSVLIQVLLANVTYFAVQIHNDPGCGPSPYTCARSVSLFLPWEGEIRLQNFTVTFKGQRVELPYNIHDIELERISQYILVTQHHGFTLAWEGDNGSVYIKMSPEYVGRTCGLCGNFNADVQDDLKTSYGLITEDVAMFGNSWTEEEPHQASCPMVPSLYPSPCAAQDAHTRLKVEEVCATLLKSPFQSCHEFVSPYSFMASCSNDLCLSGPSGDAVCQVFTEYARACAHAGHTLHDWRSHIQACAVSCPVELVYNECITCCPVSCNVERMCIDSKLQCLDGCYCPDDLIFEDGSCVKASDCPCEFHGMLYPPGQVVQEECNNCTCLGGVWNCTDYTCPGECSVTGDMFFQSFDGRVYTFPATCQYVLAKSRNSGKFTITIQNAPCGPNLDGACIQSVNLVVDEDPRTEITMSHIGEVFVSSQYRISLPYSDEMFHIQELSTMFLQVKTSQGLRLQYNWREFRLYLQVSELWKEDTVGLCGTFNGNIQDDFLAPSGMIESTPQLFGNAWRVPSACMPSLSLPQLDPCDTHQQIASYASQMCDVLNQALFAPCHAYLSPVPFHQQCRADTCKCGQPCLCSALAHYARHCRRFSIIVDFRAQVADCAITCPATMEYGMCVSACQRRCQFLSMPHLCGDECEEGCVCPLGTFYNTRTRSYKTCPPGQRYHECNEVTGSLARSKGVACEETCESHLLHLTCSTHEPCIPGCVCPEGLLKHGDECFWPEACPCIWKGKEYFPGDQVTSPCHQCVCQHGTFQCVFQPCPSMCTAYGDRHYRTFDGLLFDYVGVCKVYLVKSNVDSMLSVSAENVDCYESGVICRKSLLITIGRSVIAFDDDSGKPSPSSVVDRRQGMYIWQAGYFTIVHIPEADVTVLWDRKTTVHIQAGPRWQGKLSGLCGNFDLRTVNEMRTPENIDSATPQEFGNSWTAAECVNSPDIRHPCSLSPLREPFAKRQCGILLSEVFHVCHPVVDVTWFYMNCLADTCGCNRGGDCECFCTSVAAYAHQCCQQGVTVDWRSPSVCPYDCEYYNKVLGKGPYQLTTYRERDTVIAANRTSGVVLPRRRSTVGYGLLSTFMMTPGLSRARPHDTSLVSFEAADRPNYFLRVDRGGHLRLSKWQDSEAFFDQCTFVLHRDTWIPGYDSLESFSKPGFFLHYMISWVHLMKYNHSDGFRRATLFRLAALSAEYQIGPRCQWRYESCVSPCFRTCSDPSGQSCVTILKVEGCLPVCPAHMVLDELTQRCVHLEDCPINPHPCCGDLQHHSACPKHQCRSSGHSNHYCYRHGGHRVNPALDVGGSNRRIRVLLCDGQTGGGGLCEDNCDRRDHEQDTQPLGHSCFCQHSENDSSNSYDKADNYERNTVTHCVYLKNILVTRCVNHGKVYKDLCVPTTKTTTYRPHVEVTSVTAQPSTRRTTDWQTRPPYPETSSTPVAVTQRSASGHREGRGVDNSSHHIPALAMVTRGLHDIHPSDLKTKHSCGEGHHQSDPYCPNYTDDDNASNDVQSHSVHSSAPWNPHCDVHCRHHHCQNHRSNATREDNGDVTVTRHSAHLRGVIRGPRHPRCLWGTHHHDCPLYQDVHKIIDECTKYICVGGQLVLFNKSQSCPYNSVPPNCGLLGFAILVNGDKCCPKWDCPCRCSVFPDLNVITFDGNSVAIYKAASYVVTQLPNETVSILVQECPVSDALLWNFTNLCLVALNITHKSHNVLINRLQRRLYVNSRYAKPRFRKHGFEILDTGNMYLIRTPTGLKIQWFHSTGMMVLETDTYNKKLPTMGLCGCCDGNPANDLTLSNGTTVGESEDPAVFIDSWQLPNTTGYVSQSRRREVNCSTSDCSECLDMLHNTSFIPCHDYVPPATFCELWVRDAEYVNNPCVALAAYVASCHKFNVCIEWRSPDYCPFLCPETLRYQACLTTCTAQSCPNHEFEYDPEQCSGLTEGCVCPEGTLLHRPYSSLCIPPSKCACTDSFGTPRAVGEVWKASKDGCCMYRCENDTIVPVEYNCTETPPLECKRAGEVVISLADDKSCCPQKACVCNQTLCDAAPPECKFGERGVSYFREDSCCPDYACECDPELCETEVPPCREDQTLIATKADGSCCLAYICICDTCPEMIPKCEEGELLTVDANSTDRCCPAYHCVCEPFRCAEFSCPPGMAVSVDSLPGRCCPQHTCECACDAAAPSLKCALGEIVQPDRSYQSDPINQCGCKRYKCVRDAVCVDGERGVMRPGQTLVEHSNQGVCYATHCSDTLDPHSGYHLIRTTSTNCSAQCYPNQMYIPPKDLSSCCGVCRNISCLYKNENGSITLYKPGKTWVSDCMRYECADTQSGPTLISYSYSCPPFNETECMKIGGTIVSYMDGCCRTCKEDGKSCQKVTVRMTIRKNDCRSNRPVNIVSCDGKCPSASIYNYNINTYARFCKCCREMGLQRRTVQLYCSGNSTWVNYAIQEPTDCSCQWS